MIFTRGMVFLCSNGVWRKITGINRWKGDVYYTSNATGGSKVHSSRNMVMSFWCNYHDVREVNSVQEAMLKIRLPECWLNPNPVTRTGYPNWLTGLKNKDSTLRPGNSKHWLPDPHQNSWKMQKEVISPLFILPSVDPIYAPTLNDLKFSPR